MVLQPDLLITMRNAMRELMVLGQFPSLERNIRRWETAIHDGTAPAQLRKEQSQELLDRQRARKEAGLLGGNLPMHAMKEEIIDLVRNNTYSILVAETGAGKSTQLPQFLLERSIADGVGAEHRIFCVQPRRIAASSLARRVSAERGEALGDTVGYKVRFDSQVMRSTGSITYCTTGILVQILQTNPNILDTVSYILLDEVHERQVDLDLLMLYLKRAVRLRKASGKHVPNIVVMSATLDIELFSSYFQNETNDGQCLPAPHLRVPGRSFPVQKYYLGECLQKFREVYSPEVLFSILEDANTKRYLDRYGLLSDKAKTLDRPGPETAADTGTKDEETIDTPEQTMLDEDFYVPTELIGLSIGYIVSKSNEGSILVFLPGLRYLIDVERFLHEKGPLLGVDFGDTQRFKIMQLHSSLPEGQEELFGELQPGCRRIILATTIAETSVTIPDVRYVVDSGKRHQNVYEPRSRLTRMVCRWVSQSSIHQRAGRAGRVQHGEYFGVFPESAYERLRITAQPEIKMVDLQRTALLVKKANTDSSVGSVLCQAIEPPAPIQIQHAVSNLQALRAMDEHENITVLGSILTHLPVDPCYGKLVLLGIVFRCLDPLLILASLGADLPLFHMVSTPEARKELRQIRLHWANHTDSDHISVLNAFRDMRKAYYESSDPVGYAISQRIHWGRFREAMHVARQLLGELALRGLVPKHNVRDDPTYRFGGADLNANAHNVPLIKALLLHTLYPNLAAPTLRPRSSFRTIVDDKIDIGAAGVNAIQPKCLLAYNLKMRPGVGAQVLLNTSHVSPLSVCLFGGRLQGSSNRLNMDGFHDFTVRQVGGSARDNSTATMVLVNFRKALDLVFPLPCTSLNPRHGHIYTSYTDKKKAINAAWNALTITTRNDMRNPSSLASLSRDYVFDTISRNVIHVLEQDQDPVFLRKHGAPRVWSTDHT